MKIAVQKWRLKDYHLLSTVRGKLVVSFAVIISLLMIPLSYSFISYRNLSEKYNSLITNVNMASSLNTIVENSLSSEMWNIIAGKNRFEEGRQYEIISDIKKRLEVLYQNSSSAQNAELTGVVAMRMLDAQREYVEEIKEQMQKGVPTKQNEEVLEYIRSVSQMLYETLLKYTFNEIQAANEVNEQIQRSVGITIGATSMIFLAVALLVWALLMWIRDTVSKPIDRLKDMMHDIAAGDLSVRADIPKDRELGELAVSQNKMADQIEQLLKKVVAEQKSRQISEMQALQAQITPHFLYNTFDTIVFLAESGQAQDVIRVTRAFSNFFRISLSKGKDWISVEKEVEHVVNYLTIQQIRYSDILEYTVDVEESMKNKLMLKLILQPLVENGIYHGIKGRRGKGKICVKGWIQQGKMHFSVTDNGKGMDSNQLRKIQSQLAGGPSSNETIEGYGLYNVNERLSLYYNIQSALRLDSSLGQGTTVSFSIPIKEAKNA